MATIHRLDTHRIVHLPVKSLDDIVREHGVEAQVRDKPDFRETRHVVIRNSFLDELKADWREFVSEVRASPYSHALVAIGAVIFWTVALYLPFFFGWLS